ncbi:cation acetate symporter [Desulfuromonas thiophila]|uniref:sodium/solute symporter n=1 Tax=Desulfuromonas thiophila TaxID=57664 RepID=UPI0029F56AD5|nr:cation acetate symporter [Desulfuromonas thiophila]
MLVEQSRLAVALFLLMVAAVVGLSIQLVRRTSSPAGYFVAGGRIHWGVNGIAFVGDYLSAASFLGVSGLIATVGYDGVLYSVGFLCGWVVALFLVAEPMRRLGRLTFTDALDARFNCRPLRLVSAISTLVVSLFYLIPQMVGAGALVTPLLGIPYYLGVLLVGVVVTVIVATSGMTSTTYIQFIKGIALLLVSLVLTLALLQRGLVAPPALAPPATPLVTLQGQISAAGLQLADPAWQAASDWQQSPAYAAGFVPLRRTDGEVVPWWLATEENGALLLYQTQYQQRDGAGHWLYNGAPPEAGRLFAVGHLARLAGGDGLRTGPLSPLAFLRVLYRSELYLWPSRVYRDAGGQPVQVFYPQRTAGACLFQPGGLFPLAEGGWRDRLDFLSLMLALVCGTSALPHILIRYYTVPSQAAARRSTVVAIGGIGLFYLLSVFLGFGAMASGCINVMDSNMTLPLLARSFGQPLFAVVTAVAFTAVLGTVSGLIVAASGAVAHDIMDRFMGLQMSATDKVVAGRLVAVVLGCIAIWLGIVFEGMNVSYLAGWAFALAAAANLPALLLALFWPRATWQGLVASIITGLVAALLLILLSPEMYLRYGLLAADAPFALNQPALVALPLSTLVLVLVSRLTRRRGA